MMLPLGTGRQCQQLQFSYVLHADATWHTARSLNFVANRMVVPSGITFFSQSDAIFDQITFTSSSCVFIDVPTKRSIM